MIETFLSPLDPDDFISSAQLPGCLVNHIQINTNGNIDLSETELAIVGITDQRLDGLNHGTSLAPGRIRNRLYNLMKPANFGKISDLGNIETGESVTDTLFALQTVLHELKERNITVLILGGTEELALSQYQCLREFQTNIQLSLIGSRINLRQGRWLHDVVLDEPNRLFNMAALGFQTYLSEQDSLDAMERMYFDLVRLGNLRDNMLLAEPILRQSHMAVFDLSAIRQSDFPAYFDPSPNGLRSEEACQLARYAGLGQKMRSVGFYNCNPDYDNNDQSSRLAAQLCWFFMEGYFSRLFENPQESPDSFIRYRLNLKEHELSFYKSKLSDRWWMELPHPRSNRENTIPLMIPCLYEDYLEAAGDELPDRWWRMYQKFGN